MLTDSHIKIFKNAGSKNAQNKIFQFWQHGSHPIELYSTLILEQKLEYLHNNPVKAGFVDESYHWKYSSAGDYAGQRGFVDIDILL